MREDAKRCRTFQLIAKFIELNLYKRSKHQNSMRNDRISIIFVSLNFAQLVIQFTILKFYVICDDYQLSNKCNI